MYHILSIQKVPYRMPHCYSYRRKFVGMYLILQTVLAPYSFDSFEQGHKSAQACDSALRKLQTPAFAHILTFCAVCFNAKHEKLSGRYAR